MLFIIVLYLSYILGPLEESAIWIDEIPPEEIRTNSRGRSTTQAVGYQDPLGIIKEPNRYDTGLLLARVLPQREDLFFTVQRDNLSAGFGIQ